jgi:hypothetical protein
MSHDDDLRRLLDDAVSTVEPTDRLPELRARTTTTRGTGARWGAALAAAAAVAVVAGVATLGGPSPDRAPTAGDPTTTTTTTAPGTSGGRAVAAYFIGETPRGPRLYREFQPVASPVGPVDGLELLTSGPADPDYSSEWPEGSFGALVVDGGTARVELADAAPVQPSDLAVQQLAYTLSAGAQEPLSVVLERGGSVVAEADLAPQLEVLAPVNLSDPSEGQVVGDVLAVTGRASSYEANVLWTVEGTGLSGSFTASGWAEPRLFPFSGEIDVSSLDPGTYTLIVETDDPSGGTEGPGATSDTRTFVVP